MVLPLPSADVLRSEFGYDQNTGVIIRYGTSTTGHVITNRHSKYLVIGFQAKRYFAHRLIWRIVTGDDPGRFEVDHIDGDGLNNRFANLRVVTKNLNQRNQTYDRNRQLPTGVRWVSEMRKYRAFMKRKGKCIHLGYFVNVHDAECAVILGKNRLALESGDIVMQSKTEAALKAAMERQVIQ